MKSIHMTSSEDLIIIPTIRNKNVITVTVKRADYETKNPEYPGDNIKSASYIFVYLFVDICLLRNCLLRNLLSGGYETRFNAV